MIVIDTHILIWGVQKERDPRCPDGVERAMELIKSHHDTKQQIIIPAIVLAEYLAGQDAARSRSIHDIVGKAFFVAAFDMRCAEIAGALFDKRVADAIRAGSSISRNALKDDYKILATAISMGATHLYTHDPWIGKIDQRGVARHPVKVVELPALHKTCITDEIAAGEVTRGIQGDLLDMLDEPTAD